VVSICTDSCCYFPVSRKCLRELWRLLLSWMIQTAPPFKGGFRSLILLQRSVVVSWCWILIWTTWY
jgi:hypothetical protein